MTTRSYPADAGDVSGTAEWRSPEGTLLIGHCRSCDAPHYYPRRACPFCFGFDVDRIEAKGTGVVYSYSRTARGLGGPYVIAYVTLDEGVTMLTNIVESELDTITIGARVALIAGSDAEGWKPLFRIGPAASA